MKNVTPTVVIEQQSLLLKMGEPSVVLLANTYSRTSRLLPHLATYHPSLVVKNKTGMSRVDVIRASFKNRENDVVVHSLLDSCCAYELAHLLTQPVVAEWFVTKYQENGDELRLFLDTCTMWMTLIEVSIQEDVVMQYVEKVINTTNEREIYVCIRDSCGDETTVGYKILGKCASRNLLGAAFNMYNHDGWCTVTVMCSAYGVSEERLRDVIDWTTDGKGDYVSLYIIILEGIRHLISEYRILVAGVLNVLESQYGVTRDEVYEDMWDTTKEYYQGILAKIFIEDV